MRRTNNEIIEMYGRPKFTQKIRAQKTNLLLRREILKDNCSVKERPKNS